MSERKLRAFRRPRTWLLLWLAMAVATLIVCLLPMPKLVPSVDHFDKIEHLLGYAVFGAYAAMLFESCRAMRHALLGTIAFGLFVEGLQALVPWRSADGYDAVANTLGVLLGALVALTPASRWLLRLDQRLG